MPRQLKRWESPRREGRNAKGKGGSARQRQIRKKFQNLRQRLKDSDNSNGRGEAHEALPSLFCIACQRREARLAGNIKNYIC